jgi:Kef-type K+ transport system membrane component KefB
MPFTLFLGVSMSITAFPVLARILEERHVVEHSWRDCADVRSG